MDTKTITKPYTSIINHVHQLVSTMHQPCTSTCIIPCTSTCTIPCTSTYIYHSSTMHINLYHTMYINLYHTMYINTCTVPCVKHVPCHVHQRFTSTPVPYHLSTMYHTKYINLVSYPVHQPCNVYHKISSMKFLKHNQNRHTKIIIYPRCDTNECTITSLKGTNMYLHHQDMHLIHVPIIGLIPCTKDVFHTYINASIRYQRHDHHIINIQPRCTSNNVPQVCANNHKPCTKRYHQICVISLIYHIFQVSKMCL
jgi:hypothetical protein